MIQGETRYEGLIYTLDTINNQIWTQSNYSYAEFKYIGSNPNANTSGQEIRLTIQSPFNKKNQVILTRVTDSNGRCIFPLGDVVDSMLDQPRDERHIRPFEMNYATNFPVAIHNPLSDSDGVDFEFIKQAIRGYNEDYEPNAAFLPKIIIYPGKSYSLFYTHSNKESENVFMMIRSTNTHSKGWFPLVGAVYFDGMFMQFGTYLFPQEIFDPKYNITELYYCNDATHSEWWSDPMIIKQNIEIDTCEDGLFLRWIDKYGIWRYYRWTEETVKDEQETASEYIQLGEKLTPYRKSIKSVKHTYRLHSRFVDSDTLTLCRSIVGAQWITILSEHGSQHDKHVTLTGVEDSQTGDILNDMVIEVTETEYLQ